VITPQTVIGRRTGIRARSAACSNARGASPLSDRS
jgi:hypothetical protein